MEALVVQVLLAQVLLAQVLVVEATDFQAAVARLAVSPLVGSPLVDSPLVDSPVGMVAPAVPVELPPEVGPAKGGSHPRPLRLPDLHQHPNSPLHLRRRRRRRRRPLPLLPLGLRNLQAEGIVGSNSQVRETNRARTQLPRA